MSNLKKSLIKRFKKLPRSAGSAGVLTIVLIISAIGAMAFRKSTPTSTENIANESVEKIETAELTKATLVLREGVVEFKTDENWSAAPLDMEIAPGMSIKTTGAAGRAIIRFEDSSEVRVDANTEIRFESLTTARVTIHQNSGHLYNRIVHAEERTYSIQTENAQFQSVGTAFRTIASGDEESVEVYEKSVRETTSNKTAKQGEKLTVKNFAQPDKDGTISGLDIEAIKDNQFIAWNRELDRQNPAFKTALGFLSDFDGPAITISSPQGGSAINVDSGSTQGSVVISGTTEKGAKLTVQSKSSAGSSPIAVAVDDSGAFTTENLTAPLGSSVFEFVATDKVGNKIIQNVTYQFNKKAAEQTQDIKLTIDTSDSAQIKLSWSLDGITAPDGMQVVYGRSSDPEFQESGTTPKLVENGNSYVIKSSSIKGTNYFRVCRYNQDTSTCDIYSNQVTYPAQ